MIYLDTCYILKCYLTEHGSSEVRNLVSSANGVASCEWARTEFFAAVHRHRREGKLSDGQAASVTDQFRRDERSGYWTWYPTPVILLERACQSFENLSPTVFLRAGDALHLACASAEGFADIHTNDRHVLAAAPAFALRPVNVIP